VLVSIPDQVLYVYRNGVRIGHSTVTGIGKTVIIADDKSDPNHHVRPGLLFWGKSGTQPDRIRYSEFRCRRLVKYNGLVSIYEYSMFQMPADGLGKNELFEIPALSD
jgi:hypothetical protein